MSLIVQTFCRFVVLSICSVRRPSVALAQYRDVIGAMVFVPGAVRSRR